MRDEALSVIACGASAVLALPDYLSHLRTAIDLPLRLMLTRSAGRFVNPDGLSWHADEVLPADANVNPTEVALRSRLVVVLPSSANMLACSALGLASTPGQTVVLAAPVPALFFPSMNKVMWERPVLRRHVATLREDGHIVVDPVPRPAYSLWNRRVEAGIGMPQPADVAKIVSANLHDTVSWPA